MKRITHPPFCTEAEALPATLVDLPRPLEGGDSVKQSIVDDGSTDDTRGVARAQGVDHTELLSHNRGVAVCNAELTKAAPTGRARSVADTCPVATGARSLPVKRPFERLGGRVVRLAGGTDFADARLGFRDIGRDAAIQLHVFGACIQSNVTVIQAGRSGLPLISVPVDAKVARREFRLVKSSASCVWRSAKPITGNTPFHRPLRFLTAIATILMIPVIPRIGRSLYWFAIGEGAGIIQSLVIGAAMIAAGTVASVGGPVAMPTAAQRVRSAEIRSRFLRLELQARE